MMNSSVTLDVFKGCKHVNYLMCFTLGTVSCLALRNPVEASSSLLLLVKYLKVQNSLDVFV